MNDRRTEILLDLEAKRITVEEAVVLLEQLPDRDKTEEKPAQKDFFENAENFENANERNGGVFDWIGNLANDIIGSVRDSVTFVDISDFATGKYSKNKRKVFFESDPVSQGINGLTLIGKNDRVEVAAYDGNTIKVEVLYNARSDDAVIVFEPEDGNYKLMYDEKLMRSVQISCFVPSVYINELLIAGKNGKVIVTGLSGDSLLVSTKNDSIALDGITVTELVAESRNASVKLHQTTARTIKASTTNASITLENVAAYSAEIATTNAKIKTFNNNIVHLNMSTTNSSLKLNETYDPTCEDWNEERTLTVRTTNGSINYAMPEKTGQKIQAHTTSGNVSCTLFDFEIKNMSRSSLSGESVGYDGFKNRIVVKIATTNAGVKIRSNGQ